MSWVFRLRSLPDVGMCRRKPLRLLMMAGTNTAIQLELTAKAMRRDARSAWSGLNSNLMRGRETSFFDE